MTPLWHDGALDALEADGPVVWRTEDPGAGRRGGLAARLLARLGGLDPQAVMLARSPAGQPQVVVPRGWHLGLSGRGGQCLIGAARRPIAVDRELIEEAPPLWDMLTPLEAQALRAAPPGDRSRQWLRRWTIKEAHAKLVGTPRRLAAEAIETRLIDPVMATATCEGMSRCWSREAGGAIDTVALWDRTP